MKWEEREIYLGHLPLWPNIPTDTVHFYKKVNKKLKKFDYKGSIIIRCREHRRLFVLNLTCFGQLVFLVTIKGPREMTLTEVVQRVWYWGNYYFLPNFINVSCYDSTSLTNHSWDPLVLCQSVRCNSTDN